MKADMSPKAIENRLKLVGELTKACLLLHQKRAEKNQKGTSEQDNLSTKEILEKHPNRVK